MECRHFALERQLIRVNFSRARQIYRGRKNWYAVTSRVDLTPLGCRVRLKFKTFRRKLYENGRNRRLQWIARVSCFTKSFADVPRVVRLAVARFYPPSYAQFYPTENVRNIQTLVTNVCETFQWYKIEIKKEKIVPIGTAVGPLTRRWWTSVFLHWNLSSNTSKWSSHQTKSISDTYKSINTHWQDLYIKINALGGWGNFF